MAVNIDTEDRRVPGRLRGRVTAYVNIGLCLIGAVFIVVGVLRSTLLLYVGCAFIGAAIGGFIRSRLPIHQMHMVPPHLHMVYRHELQQNIQAALQDGMQTFLVVNGQRPLGADQKAIEKHTLLTIYQPCLAASVQKSDSADRISIISSFTDADEPSCIICLLSFKKGQQIRQLNCQHIFHSDCIDRWLKINRLCPTCRVDFTGLATEKASSEVPGASGPSSQTVSSPLPTVVNVNGTYAGVSIVELSQLRAVAPTTDQHNFPHELSRATLVINALEQVASTEDFVNLDTGETECDSANSMTIPDVTVTVETPGSSVRRDSVVHDNAEDALLCSEMSAHGGHHSASALESELPCRSGYESEDLDRDDHAIETKASTPFSSCGSEMRSSMITFSMPQNATPWV